MTLIPAQEQVSLVTVGQQAINDDIDFEIDGHYMHRSATRCITGVVTTDCYAQGSVVKSTAESWSITPSVKANFANGWTAKIAGTYSKSDTVIVTRVFSAGTETSIALPNYSNELRTVEFSAEGPLIALPGGAARLAIGFGYRSNDLTIDSHAIVAGVERTTEAVTENREVRFAYGELFLPLISPANGITPVNKLHFIGALRYEDHRGIDRVATPKVGIVYSPVSGIEIKASWGKSFKAPNLYQTGQLTNGNLVPVTRYNPGPPMDLPVLFMHGGNSSLTPERARTWSISADIKPAILEGVEINVGYYDIQYKDRVGVPIASVNRSFTPVYSEFVTLNPSATEVLEYYNSINGVFTNLTGSTFDPSQVSAIIRYYLQNISVQNLHGLDFSASYRHDFGAHGTLAIKGTASYLDSTQVIAPGLPSVEQAGIIFTPSHWRGRIGATWDIDNFTLSATANYVGRNVDNRLSALARVGSFKTLDAAATIRSSATHGLFANIEWQVAVRNLLNTAPPSIQATAEGQVLVDSVNHSLFGRVANITLRKRW